ncbi:MAG: DUF305 domain-containing protein [Gemmatimonadetes bacterium]|nr:DUF305 domain-containing protein [Gemmatimonadota bacterium]
MHAPLPERHRPEPGRGMRTAPALWTIGALLGLTAACGSAGGRGTEPGPGSAATSAPEMEAIFRARTDAARVRFTEAEVQFMTGMIGHHAQALLMAGLAPGHGANPSVRTLAARIINGQQDEIATMRQWLRDRDQLVPEVEMEKTGMQMPGMLMPAMPMPVTLMPTTLMPGMLTAEQMLELDQARDAEFDRLFLTYMIQHHRGAVTMVQTLFSTDGTGQDEEAFKLASDAQVDQITEIARMERMLAALPPMGGTP